MLIVNNCDAKAEKAADVMMSALEKLCKDPAGHVKEIIMLWREIQRLFKQHPDVFQNIVSECDEDGSSKPPN